MNVRCGGRWAREFGDLSEVKFTKRRRGGCIDLSFNVNNLDLSYGQGEIVSLRRDQPVTLQLGPALLWSGVISSSQRAPGSVAVTASGYGDQASRYASASVSLNTSGVATATGIPASVNNAVDAAIQRGWNVTRPVGFNGIAPTGLEDIGTLLDRAATNRSTTWQVTAQRELILTAVDQPVTSIVTLLERPLDVTVEDYVTVLYAEYLDSTTTPAGLARQIAVDSSKRPYASKTVDLKPLGSITPTAAAGILSGALKQITPLPPTVTGAFTVSPANLTSPGGIPISPSKLEPGQSMRVLGLNAGGQFDFTSALVLVVDEIQYDGESDTATITPVGGERRDLSSVLDRLAENPVAPKDVGQIQFVTL